MHLCRANSGEVDVERKSEEKHQIFQKGVCFKVLKKKIPFFPQQRSLFDASSLRIMLRSSEYMKFLLLLLQSFKGEKHFFAG